MTDYELGFARGEQEAWKGRGHPLPKTPDGIRDEMARGYWDARIPRNQNWARQRRLVPAAWNAEAGRYVVGKAIA